MEELRRFLEFIPVLFLYREEITWTSYNGQKFRDDITVVIE